LPNAVLVLKSGFQKNGGKCQTEYSEGTAVARERFGVLGGYCRGNLRWSCAIDLVYETKRVTPFLEIFTKIVL
jgi:hypothetical protein